MKSEEINPQELINTILNIIKREVDALLKSTKLTEKEIKLLPELLRVVLMTKRVELGEEENLKGSLAGLSTKELQKLLK